MFARIFLHCNTHTGIIVCKKKIFKYLKRLQNMLLFYIFVKKEGSNQFSSNGRGKYFHRKADFFFCKKAAPPLRQHFFGELQKKQ